MNKVLVAGASGGIGSALVYELRARGIKVVAFARGREKLISLFGDFDDVMIVSGDALNQNDLIFAAEGADVIFHAVSFPYPKWEDTHIPCIERMIKAASVNQAKIALVDNIYAYGNQLNSPIGEDATKRPHTKKGKIRLTMETKLKESAVESLIVHMPDLYGPNCENAILHETLKDTARHKRANYVGSLSKSREFLYNRDGAKAMVELTLREDTYNQNWNISATHPITGEEVLKTIKGINGYKKKFKPISKRMIAFLGMFSPFMREMVEMMYLTEDPIILSGEKYEKLIGKLPKTSYKKGLEETLEWLQKEDINSLDKR
ncbi:NAD-dependent epimerase/dehydratase family protein [Bacillus sp. FJAT-45037]|uniref:NAD-dependent epimerase/dehydratase family protein n=1 Tax=Bacillus sp. FJAT-45037 TaxID=2011007 RepID=UPI000C243686|nr:NAD-dependent epimerase/dehydratase family protein [Bacillus sp. FJAT-45037]